MRSRFASLTARLVLTAVALVVVVSVLIGVFATLAIHNRLTAQVDEQLDRSARFIQAPRGGGDFPDFPAAGPNSGPDSIFAVYPDFGEASGGRLAQGRGNQVPLSDSVLDALDDIGRAHV